MTADDFTEAARVEALRAWVKESDRMDSIGTLGAHMAEWARDRLAEQEVTDEQVEEAIEDRLYDAGAVRELVDFEGDTIYVVEAPLHEVVRAAMEARAARRDEEKRDG